MTVANNYAPVVQAGNGSATQVTGPWNPVTASAFFVELVNATTGARTTVNQGTGPTQYQVTSFGAGGWVINFNTAPVSGLNIVVSRNTPPAQPEPYTTSRGFQGDIEENSFDILTNMVQELEYEFGTAVRVPVGDAAATLLLPLAALRASHVLAFDASGNVIISNLTLAQIESGSTAAAASAAAAAASASAASGSASSAAGFATNSQNSATAAAASAAAAQAAVGSVLIDGSDTTPGRLGTKLLVTSDLQAVVGNIGGNETLTIGLGNAPANTFFGNNSASSGARTNNTTGQMAQALYISSADANKIRNPLFEYTSRPLSGTVTAGNTAYIGDGWFVTCAGANLSYTFASVEGKQTLGSLRLFCATGLTSVILKHRILDADAVQLIDTTGTADNLTFQFRLQNAIAAATITPVLTVKNPTVSNNYGSTTTALAATSMQPVPGTFAVEAYTFPCPSAANLGMELDIDFGAQLNAASGSIFVTMADLRVTPGMPVGLNSNPPPVGARPIAAETALSNYFLPAFGIVAGPIGTGGATSSTAAGFYLPYDAPARGAANGISVAAVGNFQVATMAGVDVNPCTAITFSKAGPNGVFVTVTVASGLTANVPYLLYAKTAAQGNLLVTGLEL